MAVIQWTKLALLSRDEQMDYILKFDAVAALKIDQQIDSQTDILIANPLAGRPGRVKGTRELVYTNTPFFSVYQYFEQLDVVRIIDFIHGRQNY
ncbi:type II toxin-antitoxin system RelE/ParE family toxin [Orbaceae bacterium ac157xtp]